MKNKLSTLIITALLVLGMVAPALAVDPKQFFSSGGTAVSTTLSYAVVSAYSANGGTPVVKFLSLDSDKAASKLQFYTVTAPTTANYVSTTTSLPVASTNGFVVNDIIVIRHQATDTYERRVITTFTSATNLTVTSAPTVALAVGDMVYDATAAGFITYGIIHSEGMGTNTIVAPGGGGIYSGQPGMPLLMEIDCTALGHINAVHASYEPLR